MSEKELTPLEALKLLYGCVRCENSLNLEICSSAREIIEKALKEHEQYKAIEQELGIDLMTLFKLVKSKKIYSFGHDNIMENSISGINIYDNTITIWNGYCHSNYPLSEYGKSFALTKEALKK